MLPSLNNTSRPHAQVSAEMAAYWAMAPIRVPKQENGNTQSFAGRKTRREHQKKKRERDDGTESGNAAGAPILPPPPVFSAA